MAKAKENKNGMAGKQILKKAPAKKPATRAIAPATPAKRKVVAKRPGAAKQAVVAKRAPAGQPAPVPKPVAPEQRFRMIQERAYFLAQRDDFKAHPDTYWWAAEAEVNVRLGTSEQSGDGAKI